MLLDAFFVGRETTFGIHRLGMHELRFLDQQFASLQK